MLLKTKPIVEVLYNQKPNLFVRSSSNQIYKLIGPPSYDLCRPSILATGICAGFQDGFPSWWESSEEFLMGLNQRQLIWLCSMEGQSYLQRNDIMHMSTIQNPAKQKMPIVKAPILLSNPVIQTAAVAEKSHHSVANHSLQRPPTVVNQINPSQPQNVYKSLPQMNFQRKPNFNFKHKYQGNLPKPKETSTKADHQTEKNYNQQQRKLLTPIPDDIENNTNTEHHLLSSTPHPNRCQKIKPLNSQDHSKNDQNLSPIVNNNFISPKAKKFINNRQKNSKETDENNSKDLPDQFAKIVRTNTVASLKRLNSEGEDEMRLAESPEPTKLKVTKAPLQNKENPNTNTRKKQLKKISERPFRKRIKTSGQNDSFQNKLPDNNKKMVTRSKSQELDSCSSDSESKIQQNANKSKKKKKIISQKKQNIKKLSNNNKQKDNEEVNNETVKISTKQGTQKFRQQRQQYFEQTRKKADINFKNKKNESDKENDKSQDENAIFDKLPTTASNRNKNSTEKAAPILFENDNQNNSTMNLVNTSHTDNLDFGLDKNSQDSTQNGRNTPTWYGNPAMPSGSDTENISKFAADEIENEMPLSQEQKLAEKNAMMNKVMSGKFSKKMFSKDKKVNKKSTKKSKHAKERNPLVPLNSDDVQNRLKSNNKNIMKKYASDSSENSDAIFNETEVNV